MTRISSNQVNVLNFVCECPLRAIAVANLASVALLTVALALRRQHLDLLAIEAAFLQAWHQPHRLASVSWLRHLPRAVRVSRGLVACGQAVIDLMMLGASVAIARLIWLHSHRLRMSCQGWLERLEPVADFTGHDAGLLGEPVPRFSRGATPDWFAIGEPRRENRQHQRCADETVAIRQGSAGQFW